MAVQEKQQEIDFSAAPYRHLISAFLAMEPPDVLISFARECGGGLIEERVQSFIWNHCIGETVILSDGDLSTLENMKLNLESNLLSNSIDVSEQNKDPNTVQCVYLPWESTTEDELLNYAPNIVLGADVIYDPLYLPHLVRVLSILLKGGTSYPNNRNDSCVGYQPDLRCMKSEVNDAGFKLAMGKEKAESYSCTCVEQKYPALERCPVAYIASVIRNIDTFNYFLELTEQANLIVTDITEKTKPFSLLSYAKSYKRSTIRMFSISYLYL